MKEKIQKEYYNRIWVGLKSELNSANKLEAIHTLAVPAVTCSFNIKSWSIDTKTRKFLQDAPPQI